jgi:hypothetical protein
MKKSKELNTMLAALGLFGPATFLATYANYEDVSDPSPSTCTTYCRAAAGSTGFIAWCCGSLDTCGRTFRPPLESAWKGCCNLPGGGEDCGYGVPD